MGQLVSCKLWKFTFFYSKVTEYSKYVLKAWTILVQNVSSNCDNLQFSALNFPCLPMLKLVLYLDYRRFRWKFSRTKLAYEREVQRAKIGKLNADDVKEKRTKSEI